MEVNVLYLSLAFGGAGLVVGGKVIYDKFYHTTKLKLDNVTDLRLKRKAHNDTQYKNNSNSIRTTKGI